MSNSHKNTNASLHCWNCFGNVLQMYHREQKKWRDGMRTVEKISGTNTVLKSSARITCQSCLCVSPEGVPVSVSWSWGDGWGFGGGGAYLVAVKWGGGGILSCCKVSHEIRMQRLENKPCPASETLTHTHTHSHRVTLWTGARFITSPLCCQ